MLQSKRGNGHDGYAPFVNQEWELIGAVYRATVLDDTQTAGGDLIRHSVIEEDHTVRNIFFKTVPCQGIIPSFACDDGCHAFLFQPTEETAKFCPEDGSIGQSCEERFNRIEDDSFRTNGINRIAKANEETFKVVFAGFFDLAPFDMNIID